MDLYFDAFVNGWRIGAFGHAEIGSHLGSFDFVQLQDISLHLVNWKFMEIVSCQ